MEDANQIFLGCDDEGNPVKGTVSLFLRDEITCSARLVFRDYPEPHFFWIWFDGKRNHHPIYRNWHVPNW